MDSYIPLPVEEQKLNELISEAKDFVFGLGVLVRSPKNPTSLDAVLHAPFTLLPSPVLRSCFLQAEVVQIDFNLLMHLVSNDYMFLKECLTNVIKVDDFTKKLWNICETVHHDGIVQPITLAMNRSDYMIGSEDECADVLPVSTSNMETSSSSRPSNFSQHSLPPEKKQKTSASQIGDGGPSKPGIDDPKPSIDDMKPSIDDMSDISMRKFHLRQIEFNTMAASFAGLSQHLTNYHRYFLDRNNMKCQIINVPENGAAAGLAEGLVTAFHLYGEPRSVVLFLVYAVERNIFDQRHLEYAIYEHDHRIKVIRRTMQDLNERAQLTEDKKLMIDEMEVAIVYQRCCYKPTDFETDKDWDTRLMIERSRAIVCPNIRYHLAGTKKVQQVLAQPGMVEKFIQDPDAIDRIRLTFADQFSLDRNPEGDKNFEMALKSPHLFVLKPQREGGGNNTFGEGIRSTLSKIKDSDERSSYILMRRIHPMVVKNYPILSEKSIHLKDMVSELGVYGTMVTNTNEIILNKQQGYLLRTKKRGTNEGGVATGFSVLDSPYLVDRWPLAEHDVYDIMVFMPPSDCASQTDVTGRSIPTTLPSNAASAPGSQTSVPSTSSSSSGKQTSAPGSQTTVSGKHKSSRKGHSGGKNSTPAPGSQTSVPASQTSVPASQTSAPAGQTSAPAPPGNQAGPSKK